uniref:Uncharacterized protein n=1 Tax=Sphaerodactylus townsendi TaxID=933632 RepID=A0ACB8G3B6_9SAUR
MIRGVVRWPPVEVFAESRRSGLTRETRLLGVGTERLGVFQRGLGSVAVIPPSTSGGERGPSRDRGGDGAAQSNLVETGLGSVAVAPPPSTSRGAAATGRPGVTRQKRGWGRQQGLPPYFQPRTRAWSKRSRDPSPCFQARAGARWKLRKTNVEPGGPVAGIQELGNVEKRRSALKHHCRADVGVGGSDPLPFLHSWMQRADWEIEQLGLRDTWPETAVREPDRPCAVTVN